MNRSKHKGHIFDCDGTLTDSMPLHAIAWERTMARYGIQFPPQRCYAMGGMPTVSIVEILAAENKMQLDAEAVSEEKEAEFFRSINQLQPVRFTVDLLKVFLADGIPVSVASGSTRPSVLRQLKQIGLTDVFKVIVTAEDTKRHKPEPDVFLRAAELMGIAPEACCVYEDSDLGIRAAKSAGMDWVDVRLHIQATSGYVGDQP
jgi:beta-phosphoglucomutase family hydrolase